MVGVGDEQLAGVLIRQELARKGEGALQLLVPFQPEGQGSSVHQASLVEVADHLTDQVVECVRGDLPLVLPDDLPLGVDEHQGGPRPDGVPLPHLEVAVVDDRVLDIVAEDSLAHVGGGLLGGELGRMDADDHQLRRVLLLQFPQLRK